MQTFLMAFFPVWLKYLIANNIKQRLFYDGSIQDPAIKKLRSFLKYAGEGWI